VTLLASVLIVDDEPAVRDLMARWVSALGLRPRTAANADEALATLSREHCDLAVIDIMMPGRDGLWLAGEVRREHPHTAVVLATANAELLTGSARQPIADLLVKPFRRERFTLAVDRGRQWRKDALEEVRWHAELSTELRDRAARVSAVVLERAAAGEDEAEVLAALSAERQPATAAHAERVTRYAQSVVRKLAATGRFVPPVDAAARFHDIGKIAMPDALTSKPSPLTPGEMAIMRQHVEVGADILAATRTLRGAAGRRARLARMVRGRGLPAKDRRRRDPAREPHHRRRRRVRRDDAGPHLSEPFRFDRRHGRACPGVALAVRPGGRPGVPLRARKALSVPEAGLSRPTNGHFRRIERIVCRQLNSGDIITYRLRNAWRSVCLAKGDRFHESFRLTHTTMDIARPSNVKKKRIRNAIYLGVGLIAVVSVSVGLSKLKPAAPTVERAVVWPDTVKRGPMVRQVRGLGTLTPEDIRWIPAMTQGRVEKIILRPGTPVKANDVILELTNPTLEQQLQDAELKLGAAQAALSNTKVQLNNDLLQSRAAAAQIEADYNKAKTQYQMNQQLAKDQLVSTLVLEQSRVDAEQLAVRNQIAKDQLASKAESSRAQLAVQQSAVDQAAAFLKLTRQQRDELKVRAGIDGMLQLVPVEVGAQVAPGANLARVANPSRLKAEIKIAETQAKDIQLGQKAEVDTRNGIVEGRVARIDPSVQNGTRTVDVTLTGELPKGAVPDLSVDGTIELERLNDVVFMGRPAFGQDQSVVGLFKMTEDGVTAERVQVKLGKSSVNTIEVLSGLKVGDQVILSDMSAYDAYDRIRLK
jgi:HlyD family secretion protein